METETESTFVERLAERLGAAAKATQIFGVPVEREGVTAVPVGRARWSFGAGSGEGAEGGGSGGGGGVMVSPVGYIELRDGKSRYRPIWDPSAVFALCGLGLVLGFLLGRRLVRSRERSGSSDHPRRHRHRHKGVSAGRV